MSQRRECFYSAFDTTVLSLCLCASVVKMFLVFNPCHAFLGDLVVYMNILIIGDLIGKPGRHAVHNCLGRVKNDCAIDFTIANGENPAGGTGIQPDIFKNMLEMGVDVVTSGNHIWSKKEVREILGKDARLLRPHNYPSENPGPGLGFTTARERLSRS